MTPKKYKLDIKEPHILSLIVLCAFAAMGAVLITPALPNIAEKFPAHSAQLTVTSFLFGYCLGQLIYAPIANRLGRKPAFYIGILIATLGSLFSIIAIPFDSFYLLIAGRFLEAIGASAGLIICFTIINDFYFPEQARVRVGLMMLAFSIVPGVAILTGGLITQYYWPGCFVFLLIYGLILLYPAMTMPETLHTPDPKALHHQHVLKNYAAVFKNKLLIAYSLMYGFSAGCIYSFGAEGPFIGIKQLGYAPATYGLLGLIPFSGAFVGSLLTVALSKTINAKKMVLLSLSLEWISVLSMLIFFVLGQVTIFTLLIPMFFVLMGHTSLVTNASTIAMNQTDDKANGSAVMNFFGIGVAVLMTFILSLFKAQDAVTLPIIMISAISGIGLLFFWASQKK